MRALDNMPHPFAHLSGHYWLKNPLSENPLLSKGWDKTQIEALDDEQLTALMKSTGSSHEWMQFLSQARILKLLQDRFASCMTLSFHPVEERIRLRLSCLIVRERHLSLPFYAKRDQEQGERHWITFQTGCYNE